MEEEYDKVQDTSPIPYEYRYCCALLQFSGMSAKNSVELLEKFDQNAIVSIRSAQRFYQQWRELGHLETKNHTNGNVKYSQADREMIVEAFHADPKLTLSKAATSDEINPMSISKSQIRNIVNDEGLSAFRVPKILPLNENQKKERLNFCLNKQRWTKNWNRILFTDECQMQQDAMGKKYLWLQSKDQIKPDFCDKSQKYPMKVMVWAVISYIDGPLFMKRINGTINKEKYVELLDEFFQKCSDFIYEDTIFQHDNASSHKAKLVDSWFENQEIDILDWPSNSPDLSPIENIWPHLKDHLYQNSTYKNQDEMYQIVEDFFYKSEKIKEVIKNSYDSLPKRIKQVIINNGDVIDI
ncbi:hypothetical protein ABPG72_016273 [Tetrahymena utriculariae]